MTRLCLFQFFLRDQVSNWLEHLLAGSIYTWEELTTRFLAQFFPSGRTSKLRNDILMFQQHHGESLSEAWTHYAAEGRLRKMSMEEAWNTIEELVQYEEEEWDDPIFSERGSLNYENANMEQILENMKCQVNSLMKDAISLVGMEIAMHNALIVRDEHRILEFWPTIGDGQFATRSTEQVDEEEEAAEEDVEGSVETYWGMSRGDW
ncbi:zinc finger, CCHC-type containing protein [Tanacetum coccineum]